MNSDRSRRHSSVQRGNPTAKLFLWDGIKELPSQRRAQSKDNITKTSKFQYGVQKLNDVFDDIHIQSSSSYLEILKNPKNSKSSLDQKKVTQVYQKPSQRIISVIFQK